MATNIDSFLLLLAKQIRVLRDQVGQVAKQVGPVGPAGPVGQIGPTGAPGAAGRDGTNGVDGVPGAQGPVGATGKQGPRGPAGATGPAGKTGPMPRHEWQGTKLRFQLSPTSWGAWVDLKGPRGPTGASGGGGGGSNAPGLTLDDIEQVASLLPGDEMLLARDGVFVRVKVTTSGTPDNAVTVNGEFVMVNGEYVTVGN